MIRLASVIGTFEPAFRAQYRERLRPEHTQALAAMKRCRNSASPKMQANCTRCVGAGAKVPGFGRSENAGGLAAGAR